MKTSGYKILSLLKMVSLAALLLASPVSVIVYLVKTNPAAEASFVSSRGVVSYKKAAEGFEPIAEVAIYTSSGGGPALCSGVPVSDSNWVVTAAHCIPDGVEHIDVWFKGQRYQAFEWAIHPGYETIHDLKDVKGSSSTKFDVAFIKTRPNHMSGAGVGDESTVKLGYIKEGSPVIILGYQDNSYNEEVSLYHKVPSGRKVVRCEGLIPQVLTDEVFNFDCGLHHGASGGPVLAVNDDGYVLAGVVSTLFGEKNGITSPLIFSAALANKPNYFLKHEPKERVSNCEFPIRSKVPEGQQSAFCGNPA